MEKKLLLHKKAGEQKVKEIAIFDDPHKLKMILNRLSWRILLAMSKREMYPLEIAKALRIHEQKVYYHIRKLVHAGAISITRQENKKGEVAKYYKPVSTAFGIELPQGYRTIKKLSPLDLGDQIQRFFNGFIRRDGKFAGKIVVGSPAPHGPFKTSARDGHYASQLSFFLGQFIEIPDEFAIKLDVDVKAEKEEKNNLILVGGPGTNLLTQEVNEYLPVKFNMKPSKGGFLLGGLMSERTGKIYTGYAMGIVAKIVNPWSHSKRIIVLAGNKTVGTKACVIALTRFWKKTLRNYKDKEIFARVVEGFDLDGDGKVDSIEVVE